MGGLVFALLAALTLSFGTAQAQSTWDKIQDTGKLRMGVTQAPPWYSKNPAAGEWESGLIVSIGKAMAGELEVELEMVEVTWATAIAALQADKIDMMFLDATPKRAMVVDYPKQPLLYISLAVLAKDDLTVSTWADLNKPEVTVGVPQATSMDAFLTRGQQRRMEQRNRIHAPGLECSNRGAVIGEALDIGVGNGPRQNRLH